MEIELLEILRFLQTCPPFDELPQERLEMLVEAIEISYLRRGSAFPPEPDYLLILRKGAVALYGPDQRIVTKLAECDLYAEPCMDETIEHRGEALEDTLLYQLPCTLLKGLCRESSRFSAHFDSNPGVRLRMATQSNANDADPMAYMLVEVAALLHGEPLTIDRQASIRDAALRMREHRKSSIIVLDGDRLVGLVTDRDLRNRCVAAGRDSADPVTEIMSPDPVTVSRDTLASNAQLLMTGRQIHHLPVLDGGRLCGMLSATDLANHVSESPAFLAKDIRRATDLDALVARIGRLANLQARLCAASATAQHIGETIAHISDAVTIRLIELAEEQLGPAPVPYVWMAGGSQGRQEQSAHSDQDNALLISDEPGTDDMAYFEDLARYVSDGLNRCGFVYCPGDAMATNPEWRQPLATWKTYFERWINTPKPKSLMLASIFFDLRPVHGPAPLFDAMQRHMLETAAGNGIFLAHMSANALQHRPPLGFFRNFVLTRRGEHVDTLDIKHRGIVPIIDIARVLALSEGIDEVNTTRRLARAAATSTLSAEMAGDLRDALEFIAFLRMQHQAAQIRGGVQTNNFIDPKMLSPLERGHLKDAFRVVQTMQEALIQKFRAGPLV